MTKTKTLTMWGSRKCQLPAKVQLAPKQTRRTSPMLTSDNPRPLTTADIPTIVNAVLDTCHSHIELKNVSWACLHLLTLHFLCPSSCEGTTMNCGLNQLDIKRQDSMEFINPQALQQCPPFLHAPQHRAFRFLTSVELYVSGCNYCLKPSKV